MFCKLPCVLALLGIAGTAIATHGSHFVKLRRGQHSVSSTLTTATETVAPSMSVASSNYVYSDTSSVSSSATASHSSPVAAPTLSSIAPSSYPTAAPANETGMVNMTAPAIPSVDVTVLQLAFVLENLEATFYQQALERFSLQVMIDAGLNHFQAAVVIEQVTQILVDESKHVALLADTIVALGAEPLSTCGFNFDAALADPLTFLSTARVLEAVGVGAYLGATHLLTDPSLLLAASSIVTLEARHQSLLNVLNGGSYNPQSFDIALTPQGVLSLAGQFLVGCSASDLGLSANVALTVTAGETGVAHFVPGSKLAFAAAGLGLDQSSLTCQMLIGGEPVALTMPASACYIPAGVDGPAVVYLTNATTPLASNVVIQAQQTIVAGPNLIFVDSEVTVLASVLSPKAAAKDRVEASALIDVQVSSTVSSSASHEDTSSVVQGSMTKALSSTSSPHAQAHVVTSASVPPASTTAWESASPSSQRGY